MMLTDSKRLARRKSLRQLITLLAAAYGGTGVAGACAFTVGPILLVQIARRRLGIMMFIGPRRRA